MKKQEKKWYQSKTKWAAILIGISPILATIGGILNGAIDIGSGLVQLSTQVGIEIGRASCRERV